MAKKDHSEEEILLVSRPQRDYSRNVGECHGISLLMLVLKFVGAIGVSEWES